MNLYQYCGNNPMNFIDPSGEGFYKWVYTGDKNASDEVYEAAVEAAAKFLYEISPVRGGYMSVGAGRSVGGSATISWTMDSGFGVAGRYRVRIGLGNTRVGVEGGRSWSQERGYSRTGQFSVTYAGVHGKFDDRANIKLGINYGVGSTGLIIDPSYFDNLFDAWRNIFGLESAKTLKEKKGN